MIAMNRPNSYVTLLVCILSFVLGACNDGEPRRLSLLESDKPKIDLTAEHERIRQMQLIRVQNVADPDNPFWEDVDVELVQYQAYDECNVTQTRTESLQTGVCTSFADHLKRALCIARTLQTVTTLRAESLRVQDWLIPPQSSATNVALLRDARRWLAEWMESRGHFILTSSSSELDCSSGTPQLDDIVEGSQITIGRLLAELYVDGYHLYNDLAQQQVKFILSVADSERGSTSNLELAQARSFAQLDLSRAAAAHVLVGGAPGIRGQEDAAFCAEPELTAQGQRALTILRRTGIAPGLVLDQQLPLHDFLNASVLMLPAGSVRERYKVFVDKRVPDGVNIEKFLELAPEDFIVARNYLASELKAFGRSLTLTGTPQGEPSIPAECFFGMDFSSTSDLNDFDLFVASPSTWSITGAGKLRQGGNAARALAIHKSESFTDGYVEVRASSSDNDSSGVVLRYQASGSYYSFSASEQDGLARIRRYDNGTATVLAEAPLVGFDWSSPGHLIRLAAQGNQLVATIDGNSVLTTTDDTYASGKVGVMVLNQDPGDFDDFTVYSTTRAEGCGAEAIASEFAWYPSTGNAPLELSHEYWASLARFSSTPDPQGFQATGNLPTLDRINNDSLAGFVDSALTAASEIVDSLETGTHSNAYRDEVSAVLMALLAEGKRDRPGRIFVHEEDPETTKKVRVYGYSATDGLRLVDTPNLSCAVQGHVEGISCTLSFVGGQATDLPEEQLADFTQGVSFTVDDMTGQKLYVVKPFDPNDSRPGAYEALGGFEEPVMSDGQNHIIPIVPAIAKRAAEVFKPSRDWCTYPAVECDGSVFGEKVSFDARVPLENELTEDGDGIESSWRRYLRLAKEAAGEAHALAEGYMNSGIELDRLDEQEQLRLAQDRIRFMSRAEAELETVQNICGTAIETTRLLNILRIDPIGITSASECTKDSDCPQIYHVNVECVAGRCMQGVFPILDDPAWTSQLPRLSACVGEETVADRATIGNTPVCVWQSSNGFCVGDKWGACPSLARRNSDGSYTCNGSLAQQHIPQQIGFSMAPPIVNTIGITNNSNESAFSGPCEAIRALHEAAVPGGALSLTATERRDLLLSLEKFALFSRENLANVVPRIGYQARFGNYSAITFDGAEVFKTGDFQAPQSETWPCASAEVEPAHCTSNPLLSSCSLDCQRTPSALLCQHAANCADWDQRTPINVRLLNAMRSLQGITTGGDDTAADGGARTFAQLVVPTFYKLDQPGTASIVPSLQGRLRWPGELNIYQSPLSGYANTNATGYAYTTASTNPLYREIWANLDAPAQRLILTNSTTEFYGLDPYASVIGHYQMATGDMASLGWGPRGGIERLSMWDGLIQGQADLRQWVHSKVMLNLFNAGHPTITTYIPNGKDAIVDHFSIPNGRAAEYNAPYGADPPVANRFHQLSSLVPIHQYTEQSLWDAAELFCEVSMGNETWRKTLDAKGECPSVPAFTGIGDIPTAREALMCEAELVRRRASALILERVPRIAMRNLVSFTGSRAFPEIGGEMGVAVAALREALVRFRDGGFDLTQEVSSLQYNLNRFFHTLKQVDILDANAQIALGQTNLNAMQSAAKMQIIEIESSTTVLGDVLGYTNAALSGISTGNPATAFIIGGASVMNYAENQEKAEDLAGYRKRIQELETRYWELQGQAGRNNLAYNEFERAKVLAELEYEVYRSAMNIARITNNLKADLEALDGHLGRVETLSLKVRNAIGRLTSFESSEAAITPQIRGVLAARYDVGKRRYEAAHQRAVKYAFLAKRAIEQRLGIRLAEMREDLPLVDAPQKWEARLCSSSGVDYEALKGGDGPAAEMAKVAENADPFIGEYVRNLEDVVESYTMKYGFKDATDEAVISLRDDVANVRALCDVQSQNVLYFSGRLEPTEGTLEDGTSTAAWATDGCVPDTEGNVAACLAITRAEPFDVDGVDSEVSVYEFAFGAEGENARLVQTLQLPAGTYRLSWYADTPLVGEQAMRVYDPSGVEVSYAYDLAPIPVSGSTWQRQHRAFVVSTPGDYGIAVASLGADSALRIAAPYLEDITAVTRGATDLDLIPPSRFQLTTDTRLLTRPICPDADGKVFRTAHWERQCLKICDQGFSNDCQDGTEECFWQTEFNVSQRDIEDGTILSQAGFARGNFNYRIEGIGLNFVGTGLRACEDVTTPQTCYGSAFVPYTLHHLGPYSITSHDGRVFKAQLFTGTIEHARGLGNERYLTNPLSSSDRELLGPYIRSELQGRPLDGRYRLRVWQAPGLRFDTIEDVQVYLKYRYWTRSE